MDCQGEKKIIYGVQNIGELSFQTPKTNWDSCPVFIVIVLCDKLVALCPNYRQLGIPSFIAIQFDSPI